jgi:DNA-directed RNA polymerase alpha subunit
VTKEVVVNTSELAAWFSPSLVIPAIGLLLASVVVPILLHYLKGRRDKEEKILEIRTKVYTEYFKTFEEAAKSVGEDYEKFSKITFKNAFLKLLESESSPEAIIEFQSVVGDFPNKIQNSHRKATEQTTTLKILGSKKLYELTKEFETLNQEILEMSTEWLSELNQSLVMPDFEAPIALKMKEKGLRARELKDEIIDQMRAELNHD